MCIAYFANKMSVINMMVCEDIPFGRQHMAENHGTSSVVNHRR